MVVRGCGTRVAGGVYLETHLSRHGRPLEEFLLDPPIPIDAQRMGISPIGVTLYTGGDGVTHVVDWVGSEHYPYVTDFIEEVKRHGLSRRVPQNLDFSLLTSDSRILLVHSRAIITNYQEINQDGAHYDCPTQKSKHDLLAPPSEQCAGLWWTDGNPKDLVEEVWRETPSCRYVLRPAPVETRHALGMFMVLPLHNVAVIKAAHEAHKSTLYRVQEHSNLPVREEDE